MTDKTNTPKEERVKVFRICSEDSEPIHLWFGLSYANYLTLPRSILQSMPVEWQSRFVACLEELDAAAGHLDWPRYTVHARSTDGKFVRDPMPPYDRGRTQVPLRAWVDPADSDETGTP